MQIVRKTQLVKNKRLILGALIISGLILLIIIFLISIFFLNNSALKKTNPPLIGLNELKQKITIAQSKDKKYETALSTRLADKLNILESNTTTTDEKYQAIIAASDFIENIYAYTNNPDYYVLISKDIQNFVKINFPNKYDKTIFNVPCIDKSCADTPQPKELDSILKEIEDSDFPPDVKESLTRDLINTGYKNSTQTEGKVIQYFILADMIKANAWASSSSANLKISEDIYGLVKNHYPELYQNIIDAKNKK